MLLSQEIRGSKFEVPPIERAHITHHILYIGPQGTLAPSPRLFGLKLELEKPTNKNSIGMVSSGPSTTWAHLMWTMERDDFGPVYFDPTTPLN